MKARGRVDRAEPLARPDDPLGPVIRSLFEDLRHGRDLAESSGGTHPGQHLRGQAGQRQDGVQVVFSLRVGAGRVLEAGYRAYGCPYTLATCEWLARRLPDLAPARLSWDAVEAVLGGALSWAEQLAIPPERLERLLIIEDALRAALDGA